MAPVGSFTEMVLDQSQRLSGAKQQTVAIDSQNLTIADVVAVSRHLAQVELTDDAIEAITACSDIIAEKLAQGEVIYGVNTGFGGSADTRPSDVERVQQSLISHLTCGIVSDGGSRGQQQQQYVTHSSLATHNALHGSHGTKNSLSNGSAKDHVNGKTNGHKHRKASASVTLPLNDPNAATCMPESWARASMLIRLNSLAGGASGIRPCLADNLVQLLNKDIVPRIPVRGSISASGDLSALAWIGAVMQGKTSATALAGPRDGSGAARRVTTADVALKEASIEPISLHAKEGLAIVNGTAVSAAVAALAAHESFNLAALSEVLTAMSVEALRGSDESFEPFIARIRPHPGQIDSSRNILAFLSGSKLLNRHDSSNVATLRQDRYSLRTASQWIGPVLEDFQLAHDQITIELNSVTDNPLIDAQTHRVFHGGNFQARAITSAVEKLRQGLQSLSRMLFSQCTELINPATSWGLPPNLCADDPADSYLFKGLDVVIAGLTSELGFLANPVGSHVQTAEMGNQALNSLALVSARYTLEAVDVLSQICSAHILALCQALDLRAIEIEGGGGQEEEKLRRQTKPDATPYLGTAARRMYNFVRGELGVPFLSEAHLASAEPVYADMIASPSMGLYNTKVYEAIRSGRVYEVVIECLREAEGATTAPATKASATNGH
ncbi:phenylalanine ammonia-lyase [Microdochium trichocladiopsis]|uniref:Phenylalanine ammonia-lyase n=1 Tax=Microdochium trichocladiopsis TaxID=1682393 RepID=A0A9P8Y7C7_9PEZI|nr:phenylalanine ammonia-lyase [Microdochium trichocladiopsis]KAH7033525.1 phenylalanine ammonia-lyase [Microdochium trichocladiopsis]